MHPELQALGACCRALGATPRRLARPRPRDVQLLSSLNDVGAPNARRKVKLTPLVQARQLAPTCAIAEGAWRPPRLTLGMTSFLVEHPRARFLVDPAMCAHVHQRVLPELPTALRVVVSPDKPVTGLPDALAGMGLQPEDIDFALPTHLYWDHVSGMTELPQNLPVHVLPSERDFALGRATAPFGIARRPLRDRMFHHYELDGGPILTFARSHDFFGDGSVVAVDLAGHTPGSVGVLLALHVEHRVLLAGDAAWHSLQVTLLREKAPFPGDLVDVDRNTAFASLHRLHALPPGVTVVPTYDRDAALALCR